MPGSLAGDIRVKRKVRFYQNGDPTAEPIHYSYDSDRVTTFKKLLEEIQNLPDFVEGPRITRLYTIDGRKIVDTYGFEDAGVSDFVASGPEGFIRIKGG